MANKGPFLITTTNNKYSPFTDWQKWYLEDLHLGYDTVGLLARMTASAEDFNDDEAVQQAMRDIVELNLSGKHILVVKEDYDPELIVPL